MHYIISILTLHWWDRTVRSASRDGKNVKPLRLEMKLLIKFSVYEWKQNTTLHSGLAGLFFDLVLTMEWNVLEGIWNTRRRYERVLYQVFCKLMGFHSECKVNCANGSHLSVAHNSSVANSHRRALTNTSLLTAGHIDIASYCTFWFLSNSHYKACGQ